MSMSGYLNLDKDGLAQFRQRIAIAVGFVLFCFLLLVARLTYLQIFRYEDFLMAAESNRTSTIANPPARGIITDRNGVVMATNYRAYSLELFPQNVETKKIPDLINELSEIIDITPADRRKFKRLREEGRRFDPVPIRTYLSEEEAAHFIAQRWRFPGFEAIPRENRIYPQGATGAHVLGYIGRISRSDAKRIDENNLSEEYQGLRSIGKVGVERSYEDILRGTTGQETIEITAGGRPIRSLGSRPPLPGKNLELTIDINLQKIAEVALATPPNGGNEPQTGAAVAIDPKTGEILAFASVPTYDLNYFPNGIDTETWDALSNSPQKPMLNRPLRGLYPIGSTYKPFIALAGLENGIITPNTEINDTGVFVFHNHRFRDASGVPKGKLALRKSIAISSDVYYYWLASELGVERISRFMQPWGFGQKTGIDLLGEQPGVLPTPEWKKRRYRKNWYPGDTVNLGIGQGYNQFTLLQLAHAVSTLANRGTVMTPHVVRRIVDPQSKSVTWPSRTPTGKIPVTKEHLETVITAMTDVPRIGTARKVFADVPYEVAGKTGTAQVISIAEDQRYDSKKLARRHHDHGLFIAFAPAKNPEIAIAVIRENGGFGAQAAAPVAKAMMDYWLLGKNSQGLPPPTHLRQKRTVSAQNNVTAKKNVSPRKRKAEK